MARKYIQMGKTTAENVTNINDNFAELYDARTSIYDDVEQLQADVAQLQNDVAYIGLWQTSVDNALYDSGWINLPLNSGWSMDAQDLISEIPKYRKVGKVVMLRGLVNATGAAGDVICQLPAGFRPSTTNYNRFPCVLGQTEIIPVLLDSNGYIADYTKGTQERYFLCLNGISFMVD